MYGEKKERTLMTKKMAKEILLRILFVQAFPEKEGVRYGRHRLRYDAVVVLTDRKTRQLTGVSR